MSSFLGATLDIFLESAPYLLLGFLLAGCAKVFLDSESGLARALARKGPRSVALASILGAPLPLCSCSVLPTALGLRRQGASKGATSSFLISVPETDIVSVLLTWALLGPVMAIARPVAALITAFGTGVTIDAMDRAEDPSASDGTSVEASCESGDCCGPDEADHSHGPASASSWWKRVWSFGFVEFFDDINGPLLLGLLLAGLVGALVPAIDLLDFADEPVLGYVLALAVGIPTYVCATATTPVAAGLVAAGLSPGAALVLLLAGPATNVASFVVLGREFGRRMLVVYVAGIAVFAVAAGLTLDLVFGAHAIRLGAMGDTADARAWWEIAFGILLALLMLWSAVRTHLVDTTLSRLSRRIGLAPRKWRQRVVALLLLALLFLIGR